MIEAVRRAAIVAFAVMLISCGGSSAPSTTTTSRVTDGACVADDRFDPGNNHVPNGTDVHYVVQPPSGGPHWVSPAPPGVYAPEQLPPQGPIVHALEHGYVAIWYRTTISHDDVTRIEQLGHELQPDVLVVPQKDLPVPLAATAWHHRSLCSKVDLPPVRRFVEQWRNQGPEKIPHQ